MIVVVGSHGHSTVEFGTNGTWTSRTPSSSVVAHALPFGVPLAGSSAPCVVLRICLDVISLAGPAQSRKPSMSRSETEIVLLSGFCVEITMLISSERASRPRSSIWERAEVPSPDGSPVAAVPVLADGIGIQGACGCKDSGGFAVVCETVGVLR